MNEQESNHIPSDSGAELTNIEDLLVNEEWLRKGVLAEEEVENIGAWLVFGFAFRTPVG
jgi:hypothetical protein